MAGEERIWEDGPLAFPCVVPRSAAAAAPGSLLEMHILRPHPDLPNQKLWVGPSNLGDWDCWALRVSEPLDLKVSGCAGSGRERERASPGPRRGELGSARPDLRPPPAPPWKPHRRRPPARPAGWRGDQMEPRSPTQPLRPEKKQARRSRSFHPVILILGWGWRHCSDLGPGRDGVSAGPG